MDSIYTIRKKITLKEKLLIFSLIVVTWGIFLAIIINTNHTRSFIEIVWNLLGLILLSTILLGSVFPRPILAVNTTVLTFGNVSLPYKKILRVQVCDIFARSLEIRDKDGRGYYIHLEKFSQEVLQEALAQIESKIKKEEESEKSV